MDPRERDPATALPDATTAPSPGVAGPLAAAWGIGGVLFLLLRGAASLIGPASEGFRGLAPGLALLLALGVVLPLGALKGRFVFERALVPRVVGRGLLLARRRRLRHAVLAPLFCLGLVHATRRRRIVGWTMVVSIAGFVAGTRLLPQPYRGLVAASVALGLAWGAVALLAATVRALRGAPPAGALDLPEGA